MRMAKLGPDTDVRTGPPDYLYRGRRQTLAAWCAELGVPMSTVYTRLAKGYSFPESIRPFAVIVDAPPPGGALLEHDGQRMNLCDWAAKTGLGADLIRTRLTHGWSTADALSKPKGSNRRPSSNSPWYSGGQRLPPTLPDFHSEDRLHD